jgi:derlin-1
MSDIADWFKRLPFFTRWWLALTAGFSLLGRFGIFKPYQLVLLYEPFIKQFQVMSFANEHLVQYRLLNKWCF